MDILLKNICNVALLGQMLINLLFGAGGGSRTLNPLRATDLKSVVYSSSTTPAKS